MTNKDLPQEFGKSPGNLLEEIIARQNVLFSALAEIHCAHGPVDIADPAFSRCGRGFIEPLQRNYKLIHEISSLLRRIKDGTFGTCQECSDSIDIERLRVEPTAAVCARCQSERERENRPTAA